MASARLEALMSQALASIASLSRLAGIPTQASVAFTLSDAWRQITALSLGAGVPCWERGVVRRVLGEARAVASGTRLPPIQLREAVGEAFPRCVTIGLLDHLLHDALSGHTEVTQEATARVRSSLIGRALRQGPIPRDALMVAWVLREIIGRRAASADEADDDNKGTWGVDTRDLVAYTISRL